MAYLPPITTINIPFTTKNTKPLLKPMPLINQTRHRTLNISCQAFHELKVKSGVCLQIVDLCTLCKQEFGKVNPHRRDLLIGLATLTVGAPLLSAPPPPASATTFPQLLDKVVRTRVARPAKQRSQREKDEEEEVLVVSLEQLREDKFVKFDVYINDDYDFENKKERVTRVTNEYAGSYVSLPSPRRRVESQKTELKLALTRLIDDIGADGDEFIDVVLVPKAGKGALVVNNVKIEFLP